MASRRYQSGAGCGFWAWMDFNALRGVIAGRVVGAGADEYEAVRCGVLWNDLKPDRRPAAIVEVADADDVRAAVRFARAHGLKVAIRSGGHSWCGAPLRDGGLLLDLSRLDSVSIDAPARTAVVQPGVHGRDLARQLAARGLAFPVGHCSTVAVAGFLLAGGFGWNAGSWGPSCLSVAGVDVVTAEGELVQAGPGSDLLWAAQGAGPGFFGAVTAFHLRLYDLPCAIRSSTYVYPLAELAPVAAWLPELAARLDRGVELTVLVTAAPPEGVGGDGPCVVIVAVAFAGDAAAATAAMAPLDACPVLPRARHIERERPRTFDALFELIDGHYPIRHRTLADTFWSNDAPVRVLAAAGDLIARAPGRHSHLLCVLPPPPPDAPPPDCAFSMSAGLFTAAYAVWDDPADDAANAAWFGQVVAALEPHSIGHYIAEADVVATPERSERSFAPANWQRLQALRRRWDPERVFHIF